MKKLIATMAAIVTGFAAWAALPSYTTFEGSGEFSDGALVVDGTTSWSTNGAPTLTQATYGSSAEAYQYSNDNVRYADFSGENTAYLNIKTTFGQPLERTNDVTVAADTPVYFDQLVKFTAADEEPNLELYTGEKLVIYALDKSELETGPTPATNLMVVAGRYVNGVLSEATYDFGAIDIDAWHRLTIKAIKAYDNSSLGFEIFLDGRALAYDSSIAQAYDATAVAALTPNARALNTGRKIVASLVAAATVTAVGFDGQGAIDDVMATTTKPGDWADDFNFTLNWDPETLTALSYTAHGATVTLNASELEAGTALIPYDIGMTVTVTPTFASNWAFDGFECDEGCSDDGYVLTVSSAASSATLVAKDTTPRVSVTVGTTTPTTYPSLLAALTAVNALSSGTAVIVLNQDLTLGTKDVHGSTGSEGTIESQADVTIDLNGHTITGPAGYIGYVIECTGNVTIIDSQNNTGKVLPATGNAGAVFYVDGSLQVSGGTFDGAFAADGQTSLSVTGGKFIYSAFTSENAFTLASAVPAGYTYATDSEPTYWVVTALPSYTLTVTPSANATYELTVGGETVSTADAEAGVSVRQGTSYSLTATAAEYYNYNGGTTTNITDTMGSAALTLAVPAPTADVWTITYKDGDSDFATDTYTYENRTTKELNAGTKPGYTFKGWFDGEGNLVTSLAIYTGPITLDGDWEAASSGHTVTISWSDSAISSVYYQIGSATMAPATSGSEISVDDGALFTITAQTSSDWTKVSGLVTDLAINADTNFLLSAAQFDPATDFAGKTAAQIAEATGINNASALVTAGSETIKAAVSWAETNGVSLETVNAMDFTAGSENQAAKAFLFGVPNTQADVTAAEAAFAFTSITPGTEPSIPPETTGNYNGTVTVKGCATVNGTYVAPTTTSHKFYKAELLLPTAD